MAQRQLKLKPGETEYEVCYQVMNPYRRNVGTFKYKRMKSTSEDGVKNKFYDWRAQRQGNIRLVEVVAKRSA